MEADRGDCRGKRGAERHGSYFWEFLFETYGQAQATAVRRQADKHRDIGSLGQLIFELGETPEVVTRDWWVNLWGREEHDEHDRRYWEKVAEDSWAERYGGEVGRHLDPALARNDSEAMRAGTQRVKDYVDENVAHMDAATIPKLNAEPPAAPMRKGGNLQLSEVHDAIDVVGATYQKYYALLFGASWHTLVPVLQHDWEKIFRIQWIPKEAN